MGKIIPKSEWSEVYLDWFNNFLTVPCFAEHYGITIEHAEEIIKAGQDSDNFTKGIPEFRYTIIELENGMYRPQDEYEYKTLYPAFNTFRDAVIFMEYTEKDFKSGICGNCRTITQEEYRKEISDGNPN